MGLLQRFKTSLAETVVKSLSEGYFDLKNPGASIMFGGGDREKLVNPYRQLPIVFACINAIARRVASVEPVVYREGTDTEVTDHAAVKRLRYPRAGWSWDQWVQSWIIHKMIYGEFLAIKSRDITNGVTASLDNQMHHNYRPSFQSGSWDGWIVNDRWYAPEDVLFDKFPNPWDAVRGMSPFEAARVSNDTEWSARRFNKRFFDNDATPGGSFHAPAGLSAQQRERLRQEMIESRRGSENAHSWLLLEGDMSIEQMGIAQKDAQFIEQFGLTLHDVCAVTGVDPAVIGFEKESKYASAKEARRYMWTDTVIPALSYIEAVLNDQFLHEYGLMVVFDTESVEALQDNVHQTVETAQRLWSMGVPFNSINERFDLGFEPIPGGDEPLQTLREPTIGQLDHRPANVKEAIIGPEVAEGFVQGEEARKAVNEMHWKAANEEVSHLVSQLNRKLKAYFFDVKKKLEKHIKRAVDTETKDITGTDIDDAVSFEKLASILLDFLRRSGAIGWKQVTGEAIDSVNPPQEVLNVVARRISYVKEITQHARNDIQRVIDSGLRELTQQAIEEGWPEQRLTDAISETLDHAIDNVQSRARTIARTEVHSAHSEARYEAMVSTEPVAKRWVASPGEATRESHLAAMDEGVIDWDAEFEATGLQYPMEPGGAPEEVINCRCILVPIYEGEREAGGRTSG